MMEEKGQHKDQQTKKPTEIIGKPYSGERMHPLANLKERLIKHILRMKQIENDCGNTDKTYAGWALMQYEREMPWLGLKQAVEERLNEIRQKG